jgi:hypothetical protein
MMPTDPAGVPPAAEEMLPEPVAVAPSPYRWYHKISAVLFITFCLEIGIFLLVFPWTEYWDSNYFLHFAPSLENYWGNSYLRGAISGLGAVNLYIAFLEMFRLRRFVRR